MWSPAGRSAGRGALRAAVAADAKPDRISFNAPNDICPVPPTVTDSVRVIGRLNSSMAGEVIVRSSVRRAMPWMSLISCCGIISRWREAGEFGDLLGDVAGERDHELDVAHHGAIGVDLSRRG